MVVVWYCYQLTAVEWYGVPVIISVSAVFWVGTLVQVVYYLVFHPNNKSPCTDEKRIKICVPLSELVDCKHGVSSKGVVTV